MDLLFSFLPLLPLFGVFHSKKKYDLYYLAIFIFLFVLSTFRHVYVGTDTYNYYLQYIKIKGGYDITIEPFWFLLNKVVLYFNGSFQYVLALANFLILFPVFFVAKRKSQNKYLTLYFYLSLYIFYYSLNITRQCVAMSIFLVALHELVEKRYIKYIAFVILASFFHLSAIVCLPLIFISKLPDRFLTNFLLLISAMVCGLFLHEKILGYALSLIYSNYEAFDLQYGNFLGNFLFLIILNGFYFFIFWTSKDKGSLFKLFFVYILVMNLFIRIPFGMRIVLYFSMVQLLFYPYLIYNNKLSNKAIMVAVLIVFSLCIFIMNYGHGEIFPYQFFKHE